MINEYEGTCSLLYKITDIRIKIIIIIIIIIIKYAAYYQVQGLMEDTYVRLINCSFHLYRSSASSFGSKYLLLFPKSSRSCVLLHTPFTSVICRSMAS